MTWYVPSPGEMDEILLTRCSHCGSEICCVCGSSWTVGTGCINSCKMDGLEGCAKSEAEVEVKAICEESPAPECADVTHILEILEAGARSIENKELQELRRKQLEEQDRFLAFEQKQKWMMWTRHGQRKVEILDKHGEVEQEMKKRVSVPFSIFVVRVLGC